MTEIKVAVVNYYINIGGRVNINGIWCTPCDFHNMQSWGDRICYNRSIIQAVSKAGFGGPIKHIGICEQSNGKCSGEMV